MKRFVLALFLLSSPALAFDNFRGGSENDYYLGVMYARERSGVSTIAPDGGWYISRDTVYLASPRACITPGTDVRGLFHAGNDPYRRGPVPGPWGGVIPGDNDPWYRARMTRSPWGRNIYRYVLSHGWLDTPEEHTLDATALISLGVPMCR